MEIGILDFGGQYCHLIARRIRDLGVHAEIIPHDASINTISKYKGLILSGGPSSVYSEDAPKCDPLIFFNNIPVLGICYGMQLMMHTLGGSVQQGLTKEFGKAEIDVFNKISILNGLKDNETVWMSHGDMVGRVAPDFQVLASSSNSIAAVANHSLNLYGVQFHPEVTHTPNGNKILDNFIDICGCKREWNMDKFLDAELEKIKILNKKVFMLVSGGVDSTVAFALLNKALGNVIGLHIDNGFMRLDESKNVKECLENLGFDNLIVCDASEEFISSLNGISEPEEKRKAIGKKFIEIQQREMQKLKLNDHILGQGTIYPDTIESKGTKNADLIKTHHNRVEIVQEMIKEGRVIEPLSQLYKDEVRIVGKKLGLPDELVNRHPFPGPGLAIRCIASEEEELAEETDDGQRLPLRSVGVQGDERTFRKCLLIDSFDLQKSTGITNSNNKINRVICPVFPQKVPLLRVKRAYVTKERLDLLRNIDAAIMDIVKKTGEYNEIWQFPVVLAPVGWSKMESIILRPIVSEEAMTASVYKLKPTTLASITYAVSKFVDMIAYDLTNKPPGTIEWE